MASIGLVYEDITPRSTLFQIQSWDSTCQWVVWCVWKKCYIVNHVAYKCVCATSLIASQRCAKLKMEHRWVFRTVHYLDCLVRTQLWKYSVCALVSHALYGQQQLSAVALKTIAVKQRDSAAACSVTSRSSLYYCCMSTEVFTQ